MNNIPIQEQTNRLQEPIVHTTGRYKVPPVHILVVDDEPLIAQSISDFLTLRSDYIVSLAGGGRDAMTRLEHSLDDGQRPVDLLLLDIDMPAISGLEVLSWIRDQPRLESVRVLMLTGIDNKRDMAHALSHGADDYITKPYHPQELLARIRSALRTQLLEKQLQRQSKQLNKLNTIGNSITRSLDMNHLLKASAKGINELLSAEMTAIYMYDTHSANLKCKIIEANEGITVSAEHANEIPTGSGVISRAYESRVTHCVNDAPNDARFMGDFDVPRGYSAETMIAAPLFWRGHPFAVLVAYNKKHGEFTGTDVDLFVTLAHTITQAIDNSTLYNLVKRRQAEVTESRNALGAIIDGILHPIYTINNQWEVVSVNTSRAEDQDNSEPSELQGKICYQVFYNRDSPCEHCRAAQVLKNPDPQKWTVRSVGSDFLPIEWDVNAYPVPGKQSGTARAVIVWQDRSEERRMESSLHQAAKLSAIGQLAAGVAHEINNPLTVISSGAEMLKDVVPKENSEDYELVEWISNASDKAIKVVRGLLDFARQSRYEFQLGNLAASIEDSIELVEYQMRKSNIEVIKNIPSDLPDLVASWEHLKTVWVNLLINSRDALKDRAEDARRIEITARTSPKRDHIQIFFHDTGEGIPQEQLAHIFVPFYTTKDPGKGTGLGLATAHTIVDRHGGEITVTSEVGKGTTFILLLPVSEVAPERTDEELEKYITKHS